jgi:large subunit ribosomal protein L18
VRGRPKLILPHRRHREGKTDYHLRLKLLKSRKPRLVVRRSLSNFTCQIIRYEETGDVVMVSADSKELKAFGWKFHCGNTPAAYLTGLLCAERAKKHKIKEAILDLGLYETTSGNALFSALKGAVDGGLEVPHSDDALPPEERISGKHISAYAEKLSSSEPAKYKKIFSAYLREKADPKEMPAAFEETKKKIIEKKGERTKAHHAKTPEHEDKKTEVQKAEHHEHKPEHQEHKTEHKERKHAERKTESHHHGKKQ